VEWKKQVLPSPQLFKPFLDLDPAGVADVAMLTIRAVDSQEGEQVAGPASQVHDHLIHMFQAGHLIRSGPKQESAREKLRLESRPLRAVLAKFYCLRWGFPADVSSGDPPLIAYLP
jgi:hypothetical protein